jgi:hypothetical protein
MALGIEEALLAYTLYKMWRGGGGKGGGGGAKDAPWPKDKVPLTSEDKAAIAAQQAQHGAETTKFQAQLAEAKAKAGSDKAAQADIARKAKERQKALDDWKRDIEAAKRGEKR